jgi:hypothetical protein
MSDPIKKSLPNPTLRFARELAAARLKRAGVKPSYDWSRDPEQSAVAQTFPAELIKQLAG